MKRERFNQIQAGEKIIWRARARAGLTRGETYQVYGKTKENELVFKDDNHEFKMARAVDFAAGDFHLVSDEWYAGTKAGDRLMFRGYAADVEDGCPSYLTLNKVYTAQKDDNGDICILDDNEETEYITMSSMRTGVWLNVSSKEKPQETRHILPEDYWSIIDFALETGDREWYDELMKKAKMPV